MICAQCLCSKIQKQHHIWCIYVLSQMSLRQNNDKKQCVSSSKPSKHKLTHAQMFRANVPAASKNFNAKKHLQKTEMQQFTNRALAGHWWVGKCVVGKATNTALQKLHVQNENSLHNPMTSILTKFQRSVTLSTSLVSERVLPPAETHTNGLGIWRRLWSKNCKPDALWNCATISNCSSASRINLHSLPDM